jgi:hypothetical protein
LKNTKRIFIINAILGIIPLSAHAHEETPAIAVFQQQSDTSAASENNDSTSYKKHYAAAASGVLLVNGVIGAWDRFVIRSSWAQVTLDDALCFYEHEQTFDTDWYWTNFALHPYQGSLDYMAARNCNLSPLESELCALGGSFIWEYFCETNSPSINDMIYTPVGGFAFGEMLYRLSLETYVKNNYLAWLLNPLRLYTVPVTGDRPHGPTGMLRELSYSWMMGSSYGATTTSDDFNLFSTYAYPVHMFPRMDIVYGNPYGLETNTPYNQFDLTLFGGIGLTSQSKPGDLKGNSYNITILSDGILFSRAPDWGKNKLTTVGACFDYDFIWNPFIELSTLAPGFVIKQQIQHEHSISEWEQHLDIVAFGTSDYYYFVYGINVPNHIYRDYSYNFGFKSFSAYTWKPEANYIISTKLFCYALYDFKAQRQDNAKTGWELAGIGTLGYEHKFTNKVSIGIENILYFKTSLYTHTYHRTWQANETTYKGTWVQNDTVIQSLVSTNLYIKFQVL